MPMSTGTVFAVPFVKGRPGLEAVRGTYYADGSFKPSGKGRPVLPLDPRTTLYVGQNLTMRIVAEGNLRMNGIYVSVDRLLDVVSSMTATDWKAKKNFAENPQALGLMTYAMLKAHSFYGKTMPTEEVALAKFMEQN